MGKMCKVSVPTTSYWDSVHSDCHAFPKPQRATENPTLVQETSMEQQHTLGETCMAAVSLTNTLCLLHLTSHA